MRRFDFARLVDLGFIALPKKARPRFNPKFGAGKTLIYASPLKDVEDNLFATLRRTETLTANLTRTDSQVASLNRTEEIIADLEKGYRA